MVKSKLYWASVGGQKTEPVRVVEFDGKQMFYSIGCTDPHDMEGIELIAEIDAMPLSKRRRLKMLPILDGIDIARHSGAISAIAVGR